MAKTIKPHKVVIEFDEKGEFKDGVLIYQMDIDGAVERRKYYTKTITGGVDGVKVNAILNAIKTHVKNSEGL